MFNSISSVAARYYPRRIPGNDDQCCKNKNIHETTGLWVQDLLGNAGQKYTSACLIPHIFIGGLDCNGDSIPQLECFSLKIWLVIFPRVSFVRIQTRKFSFFFFSFFLFDACRIFVGSISELIWFVPLNL